MKPTPMTAEVAEMISARDFAERRGDCAPLGRLINLLTPHGMIEFPSREGLESGPDIATSAGELLMLGPWLGLPDLRINTTEPCPKCLTCCDVCAGTKKKLCELCGGRKWTAGRWLACPGTGCTGETGKFKVDCAECHGSGQVAEQIRCGMCEGSGEMICPRCQGTGKYATGRKNGSVDWDGPKCKACDGTTKAGRLVKQDVEKFLLSVITGLNPSPKGKKQEFFALGPIRSFALRDFGTKRIRLFDAVDDFLVLLVPASRRTKVQKAYLLGGAIREHDARVAVGA